MNHDADDEDLRRTGRALHLEQRMGCRRDVGPAGFLILVIGCGVMPAALFTHDSMSTGSLRADICLQNIRQHGLREMHIPDISTIERGSA